MGVVAGSHQVFVSAIAAVIGVLAGTGLVFGTRRFVAYRVESPGQYPSARVLLPLGGIWWFPGSRIAPLGLEILAGGILGFLGWYYGLDVRLALGGVYVLLLLWIAFIDLEYRLVPNRLSYPGTLLGLVGSLVWPHLGIVSALEGAAVGLVVMGGLDLIGRGRLGTGDTKLAVCIGAMRGFTGSYEALFMGIVLGGVGAAVALVILRRDRTASIPYAPYLVAGAVLSLVLARP